MKIGKNVSAIEPVNGENQVRTTLRFRITIRFLIIYIHRYFPFSSTLKNLKITDLLPVFGRDHGPNLFRLGELLKLEHKLLKTQLYKLRECALEFKILCYDIFFYQTDS